MYIDLKEPSFFFGITLSIYVKNIASEIQLEHADDTVDVINKETNVDE